MGKVHSKHGSYDLKKERKKIKKVQLPEPVFMSKLNDFQVYGDQRSKSMSDIPSSIPGIHKQTRPHTFIQTSSNDYEFMKKEVSKSCEDFTYPETFDEDCGAPVQDGISDEDNLNETYVYEIIYYDINESIEMKKRKLSGRHYSF